VALEWGADEHASLAQLAAAAPSTGPWGDLLRSHLEAMTVQAAHIREVRDANEQFLRAAARSSQETMSTLQPENGTYDSHGAASSGLMPAGGGHLFDKEL